MNLQATDDTPVVDTAAPLIATFGFNDLSPLRQRIAVYADAHGLHGHALDGYILAVNEVVANAIAHGGGCGRLRMWSDGERLRCQISDSGPGLTPRSLSPHRPPLSATGGRGLWMARQFCHLDIRSSPYGTTVELSVPKPANRPVAKPAVRR
jgi:signal transduction histidine kinase